MFSKFYTFVDIVQHEYVKISRTVTYRSYIGGRSMDASLFIYAHREERKKRCVEDPTTLKVAAESPKVP